MAWTAPRTWVNGETPTAALFNAHVRDNLKETEVAKAATAGDLFAATGANALAAAPLKALTSNLANWWYKIKTLDSSTTGAVISSPVLDSDLVLTLAASEVWIAEYALIFYNAGSAVDLQLAFTAPSGAIGSWKVPLRVHFNGTIQSGRGYPFDANGSLTFNIPSNYTPIFTSVWVTNGSEAGDLKVNWSAFVSDESKPLFLKKGSLMRALKAA